MSTAELYLAALLEQAGIPAPEREYRFDAVRRWRFDFAWPERRVAVEVEGITPSGSRHQRLPGFLRDAEKYEAAQVQGWMVYRVPSPWVTGKKKARPNEIVAAVRKLLS